MGWSIMTRVLVRAGPGRLDHRRALAGARSLRHADGAPHVARLRSAACGLGLGQAVLRYFPTARARGDRTLALRLVRWTLLPQLLAWGAALALTWLLGGWIAQVSFPVMASFFLLGVGLLVAELAFGAARTWPPRSTTRGFSPSSRSAAPDLPGLSSPGRWRTAGWAACSGPPA